MTFIADLIQDLKEELNHLERYEQYPEIQLKEITPLWYTNKYDGLPLCGFCRYKDKIHRFQIIYGDNSSNFSVYILIDLLEDQLIKETERHLDWTSMVGKTSNFTEEEGKWVLATPEKHNLPGAALFFQKYYDENRVSFKEVIDYSNNKILGTFIVDY